MNLMFATEKHLLDLAERAKKQGKCTFSNFLNESEQSFAERQGGVCFGGADFCERKIARFGDDNAIYPICILQIVYSGSKFSEKITHRDVLGAIISLGVERDTVGDIFVDDEKAFAVVHQNTADFVLQQLTTVKHCTVNVQRVNQIDKEFAPKLVEKCFTVNSPRIDALIGGTFNLAREKSASLITDKRVSINGIQCEKVSKNVNANDVISVRGYGKFEFLGETGTSRKGKTYVKVAVYR